MNMRDYQAGRARGLELALDIAKKDGIEALEKEVQIRGRTGINSPVSLKDLTVALPPLRRLIQEAYTVLVIETLHTELGFGPKRVNKFMERFYLKQECLVDGVVEWQDYIDAMYDEMGIQVETGAMEAEGLIKAQEKRERKRQKRLREA
jgi:hypothetical protein